MSAVPAVSVLMTSYRDELPRLKAAVDSILGQDFPDLELVLVFEPDDVNAAAIPQAVPDQRLIVVCNETRAGKAGSFNRALSLARGRYIARMDSDDYAYPHRIRTEVDYLRSHPEIALVGGAGRMLDDAGNVVGVRQMPETHDEIVRRFSIINAICHPTVMWDRERVGYNLRYDPAFSVEDLELWFRLIARGHRFTNIPEILIDYKQTAECRRPRQNWLGNLRVRAVYWRLGFREPLMFLGLALFAFLALMPRAVVDRLTERSKVSDALRAIRPSTQS